MSVVSDASVLIFLGKVRRLHWLKSIFRGSFFLPELVRKEVLTQGLAPSEEDYLHQELQAWETVPWRPHAARLGGGLSLTDVSVLEVAKKNNAEWVLADEKALRQILTARHCKVMGTLGIILLACQKKIAPALEVRDIADELVTSHRFRISADTYQSFLKILSGL